MLKNYIKTAWRNLKKNRFYSFVNMSGLAIGLAVGLIILLWVQDEFSYDSFHTRADNIYKLENFGGTGSSRQLWQVTTAPIGMLAKKELPAVEDVARMSFNWSFGLYKYKDKIFTENGTFFTDPSLFSMFDFPIIKGNAARPFTDDHSIVISQSTAKKYFGEEDPIGKIISGDDKMNFKVTAVMKDVPKNSSIQADILFPFNLMRELRYTGNTEGKNLDNDFSQFDYNTFLLLKPGTNLAQLSAKIRDIHLRMKSDDTDIEYVFLPLKKMHLFRADGADGGFATVRMFMIIAILILGIACINYVNLSTARSMLRAKEVSLRKIVGAAKIQLLLQFIIETALLFLFATTIALVLVYLLVPVFNQVSGKELVVNFYDIRLWKVIGLTILGTLLVSSIYPALLLSSFEPLKAMRGKISASLSSTLFRRVLVVVQFSCSVALISGTIIIGRQLSYIRSRELGYDRENVLSCNLITMRDHIDAVRSALLADPAVRNVAFASSSIVNYGGQSGDNSWDGKQPGETMFISPFSVDKDFIPFFKMNMKEGNIFTGSVADSTHFILNETAVTTARLRNPIGKRFKLWKTEGTIIGVVKDFHFTSLRHKILPAVFFYQPRQYNRIFIKTTGKDAPNAIAALGKLWKKYNPEYPFDYAFLDESFNRLYTGEQRTETLFNLFAGIAILISCLGLLGLAAYTAQTRTREIGVRKVLGASVAGIVRLLALDFVRLVLIGIVVAIPIAWYAMNQWLQDFAYKTNIGWTVFLFAGLVAIVIALFTISFQSIRAALANPTKSLRTE